MPRKNRPNHCKERATQCPQCNGHKDPSSFFCRQCGKERTAARLTFVVEVSADEAARGTDCLPGSVGKIAVMEKRAELGLPLNHPDDLNPTDDFEGVDAMAALFGERLGGVRDAG